MRRVNKHGSHQSPQLGLGLTATYDEEVSKDRLRVNVQHENVDALFILQGVNQ